MAYSADLKRRVLAFYDRGLPTAEVARRLDVSRSW
jgi:transposase-like protein